MSNIKIALLSGNGVIWEFVVSKNFVLFSRILLTLFVVLFLGNAGVENENLVINIIVNTWILIVLVVVITVLFLSVVRGLMGRFNL